MIIVLNLTHSFSSNVQRKVIKEPKRLQRYLYDKISDKLFISSGKSEQLNNTLGSLCKRLKKLQPKVKNPTQIRLSVISHWLEKHDIRIAQYMAGHRYVSSTERYRKDQLESLQDQLEKLHPLE